MIRPADSEKPWRELLRESFEYVQAQGGLFALDLEYYAARRRNTTCAYLLVWSNRLAAETKSGRLLRSEGGPLRTGPASETMTAVTEALEELRNLREGQRRVANRIAARIRLAHARSAATESAKACSSRERSVAFKSKP